MIDWFVETLRSYPEIAILLSLGFGYYFGAFNYKGLGLGAGTATFLPCRRLIRWHDWGLYCKLKYEFQTDMTLSKNLQENDAAPHDGLVEPVGVAQEQNLLRLRR